MQRPFRLFDGGGLYLEVHPTGARYWRLKYRWVGKEKRLALGVYPKVSLRSARLLRDTAKESLSDGQDPGYTKKALKATRIAATTGTFRAMQ